MITKIIILTLIFEGATILGRVFWGSKQEKFRKNPSKFKIRVHHGYTGLLLLSIGFIPETYASFGPELIMQNIEFIMILGWAFFISDAIHHFIVLPLWVKRTEFP